MAVMTVGHTASRELAWLCSALADYSKANAAAFSERYDEECEAWTADEILEAAKRQNAIIGYTVKAKRRTARSVGLLRYNLDDCATVEALHAVISILQSEQYRIHSAPEREETGVRPWV